VSGDNHVSLISERELHDLVLSELPGVRSQRSRLMDIDPPKLLHPLHKRTRPSYTTKLTETSR
jgi:hypothetical protein